MTLLAVAALVAAPSLYADLTTTPTITSSQPLGNALAIGNTLFFTASTPNGGNELFVLEDGAVRQVKDIRPGASGSFPNTFAALGTRLFFLADDGSSGREPWISDGTSLGTQRLRDTLLGTGSGGVSGSVFTGAAELGGAVYFSADDGLHGEELWRTDGTTAGTVMVADLNPTLGESSGPDSFITVGGALYFRAEEDGFTSELYRIVPNMAPAKLTPSVDAIALSDVDGVLFLEANGFVCLVASSSDDIACSAETGGREYVRGAAGSMVYRQGGGVIRRTSAGNFNNVTSPGTDPRDLFFANDRVYFDATVSARKVLRRTDGSTAVTVTDLDDGSFGQSLSGYGVLGTTVLAKKDQNGATGGRNKFHLFAIAPNDAVTQLTSLAATPCGGDEANPGNLVEHLGRVYFASCGNEGTELWSTDGTPGGTALVANISSDAGSTDIQQMAGTAAHVVITDPTRLFLDKQEQVGFANPRDLQVIGDEIFFLADTAPGGVNGTQVRKIDGTVWTTVTALPLTRTASTFHRGGGDVYVVANDASNQTQEIYAASKSFTSIGTISVNDPLVTRVTQAGTGALIFSTRVGIASTTHVFGSNGTSTTAFDTFTAGEGDGAFLTDAVSFGGKAYFGIYDNVDPTHTGLWSSDGATLSRVVVTAVNITNIVAGTQQLFMSVDDGINGEELFVSDGASVALVKNIATGGASSSPSQLTRLGDRVFFVANDGVAGGELWVSDGTSAGTTLLRDIAPGSASSTITVLHASEALGLLYFSADDGTTGSELWQTDGTAAGTVRLTDLAPGALPSSPLAVAVGGGLVVFGADDGAAGREAWQLPQPGNLFIAVSPPSLLYATRTATFTVTVSNDGPGTAYGVIVHIPIELGGESPGCTESGGELLCALGDLGAGESEELVLSVGWSAAGAVTFSATATADSGSDRLSGDSTSATALTVEAQPDLRISLPTMLDAQTNATTDLRITAHVENVGAGVARDVALDSTISGDGTFALSGDMRCSEATLTSNCLIGALAPGESADIELSVTTRDEGMLALTLAVATSGPDATAADNSVSTSTTIVPVSDLSTGPKIDRGAGCGCRSFDADASWLLLLVLWGVRRRRR